MNHHQSRTQAFSTPIRSLHSASTGKLHKERSSYGPTVCLISKSPEKGSEEADDKLKIFMLILQIQRLQYSLNKSKSNSNERDINEINLLQKQLSHLRIQLEKSEAEKFEDGQKYNRVIYSQTTKLSEYEAQLNIITRKLREIQDENDSLRDTIRNLETQIVRKRAENERANMSMMMNSQAELYKSTARQRALETDLWREKLQKYEGIINEQKALLSHQKEALDKLKNTEYELKQQYDYQLSQLHTTNDELRRTISNLKSQKNEYAQTRIHHLQLQLNDKDKELLKVEQKIKDILSENNKIADRAERLDQKRFILEKELEQKDEKLQQYKSENGEGIQKLKKKVERLRKQNSQLKVIIQNLRIENQSRSTENMLQLNSMTEEIESRDATIKRLMKSKKTSNKMMKSTSESNLTPKRYKKTDVELNGIMADVMELQDSNSRVNFLINSNRSMISQNRFTHYGL